MSLQGRFGHCSVCIVLRAVLTVFSWHVVSSHRGIRQFLAVERCLPILGSFPKKSVDDLTSRMNSGMMWSEVQEESCPMAKLVRLGNYQRKFSSKTSELRTNVQGQFGHHVIHIVSKSSSGVGAVERSNSSGTCEFTGENTLGRKTLFFWVMWLRGWPK